MTFDGSASQSQLSRLYVNVSTCVEQYLSMKFYQDRYQNVTNDILDTQWKLSTLILNPPPNH